MKLKIRQHPRMKDICIGDEVMCQSRQLYARVEEVFPAAVCVKLAMLYTSPTPQMVVTPQLWRADDIQNLSVCRYCHTRHELQLQYATGIPFRVCEQCLEHDEEACE